MPEHISIYSTRTLTAKVALIATILAVVAIVWFGVRFQIGDLVSEVTSVNDRQAAEMAQTAVSLAPMNPRAHWLRGAIERKGFDQPSIDAAVTAFDEAARSGPNNYRWWTELGRAHEQNANAPAAEKAYLKAVELAPEYTSPRWQLGNFYLRQGKNELAIPELAAAAEHSALYRGQVFAIAWNVFGNDVRAVEQFANAQPESRSSLALFYASQNRPDDAIRNWNMIPQDRKDAFDRDAETAAKMLLNLRSYAGALEFSRQSGVDPSARGEAITNGDFESAIKNRDQPMFDWSPGKRDGKLEFALDGKVKNSGGRSLRLTFRGYTAPWLESVSQTVVTGQGRKYRISFVYRTEDLRGGSLPRMEVLNVHDNSFIAASTAFQAGTNEWQQGTLEFASPENADGVTVKIGREPCAGECPLIGIVWVDDVVMTRM